MSVDAAQSVVIEAQVPEEFEGLCLICDQARKFQVLEVQPTRNPTTAVLCGPCPEKHDLSGRKPYIKRKKVEVADAETGLVKTLHFKRVVQPRGYVSTIKSLQGLSEHLLAMYNDARAKYEEEIQKAVPEKVVILHDPKPRKRKQAEKPAEEEDAQAEEEEAIVEEEKPKKKKAKKAAQKKVVKKAVKKAVKKVVKKKAASKKKASKKASE
jgi:hypothetical protein